MEELILKISDFGAIAVPALSVLIGALLWRTEATKIRGLLICQLFALALATVGCFTVGMQRNDLQFSLLTNFLDFRLDFFASCLLLVIASIATFVLFYSERYLVGDALRLVFMRYLVALATTASLLVISDNLVFSLLCWNSLSLILWRLVALRTEARKAAQLVLLHHLASDIFFAIAVIILITSTHAVTISELNTRMPGLSHSAEFCGWPMPIHLSALAGLLLILSMSIKSALFPFHRWLLATLEAPTPLSGLLHAGVVNVSAILAARLWPVLSESSTVLLIWGIFAAFSAVAGTLIMSAQSDVKRKLVFSTVGQMGFMCLQCASGAIPAAVFHLVAHGLFKCHMFLQSGSAVAEGQQKKRWNYFDPGAPQGNSLGSSAQLHTALAVLIVMAVLLGSWLWAEHSVSSEAALSVLVAGGAICFSLPALKRVNFALLFLSGLAGLLFIFCSDLVAHFFDLHIAPEFNEKNWLFPVALFAFALIGFGRYIVGVSKLGKAFYVHALNGFYVDQIVLRITRSWLRPNIISEEKS